MNETFTFDDKKHIYYLGDKKLTGVTSIIGVLAKPQLIGWAAKMAVEHIRTNAIWLPDLLKTIPPFKTTTIEAPDEIKEGWVINNALLEEAKSAHQKKKEAAGEHGTDTHALVEQYITFLLEHNSGSPDMSMGLPVDIEKFWKWAKENVDYFLFSERKMFDKELFIAGTADFAYVGKDGKRYMADFKTSSGIYGIDYWLQVAAYRMLAEKSGDVPYDGATVVRLGKDGSFEVQQRFDYETDKEAFLACLTLYRAQATYKK